MGAARPALDAGLGSDQPRLDEQRQQHEKQEHPPNLALQRGVVPLGLEELKGQATKQRGDRLVIGLYAHFFSVVLPAHVERCLSAGGSRAAERGATHLRHHA